MILTFFISLLQERTKCNFSMYRSPKMVGIDQYLHPSTDNDNAARANEKARKDYEKTRKLSLRTLDVRFHVGSYNDPSFLQPNTTENNEMSLSASNEGFSDVYIGDEKDTENTPTKKSVNVNEMSLSATNEGFIDDAIDTSGGDDKDTVNSPTKKSVNVNEMIVIVGEYGRFQKILTLMLSLLTIPSGFNITNIYFLADRPNWMCALNSTVCTLNGTFKSNDNRRCLLPRNDWEYVVPKDYSVQTQYDVVCSDDWLISFSTTLFFLAWMVGAVCMGWVADNLGRKRAIFISETIVLTVSLASAFAPNFYWFIIARGIVGFFCPGTFPQMFILISEVVGEKHRAFAGIVVFFCVSFGSVILCAKAYFIRSWGYLTILCSAPYLLTLFFYFFVPESIRFLRIKGRIDEAMKELRRIANWNKREIPSHVTLTKPPAHVIQHRANPLDLFRTRTLAMRSLIQAYVWYASGVAYVGLYLVGEDLSGGLYRDYMFMAIGETIGVIIIIDLTERIGRKLSVIGPMLIGAIICVGLGVMPKLKQFELARLILGIIGKGALGGAFDALHTWSVELYPANIRGEGMGLLQVSTRIGTGCSPWVANELKKLHPSAPFVTIGIVSLLGFIVMFWLPETKGTEISDTDSELESSVKSETVAEFGDIEMVEQPVT